MDRIQDHASGSLLVTESGGIITNSMGGPLNFGLGTTLGENFGIVAAGKEVHGKIIEAIGDVRNEMEKEEARDRH
jgi:3'(2'), 5'-bisphosphate nucleotidase